MSRHLCNAVTNTVTNGVSNSTPTRPDPNTQPKEGRDPLRSHRTSDRSRTGIPSDCVRCSLPLDARNLTGLCSECKRILRDLRAGYAAPEVSLDEARVNFVATFRYRKLDASAIYGASCRCGRFALRHDTGLCEWCTAWSRRPWRPKKVTARKRSTRSVSGRPKPVTSNQPEEKAAVK